MAVLEAPTQEIRLNGRGRRGLPLHQIEAQAVEVDFRRGSRRVIAALVYYPARLTGALVSGLSWAVAAWRVGYADGRHPERRAGR